MERYQDILVSRRCGYTVGYDRHLECHFLSILVSNRMVDHEEYDVITERQCFEYAADEETGRRLANACRAHQHDDKLTLPPGSDRGTTHAA